MSDVEWYGNRAQLTKSWKLDITKDKAGLWKASQTYYLHRDDLGTVVPATGSPHPDYNWLKFDEFTVTGMKGDWLEMRANYVGASRGTSVAGGGGGNDPDNPAEYANGLRLSGTSEPLATNYFFEGIPDVDIQEAVSLATQPPKDQNGKLKRIDTEGWDQILSTKVNDGVRLSKLDLFNKLRKGVVEYLEPRVEYFQRYTAESMPLNIKDINKIDTPPGAPEVEDPRNWLLTGYNITERLAEVYEIEKTWLLSGRSGWDTEIYEST